MKTVNASNVELKIIEYSDFAIAVVGDTKKYKDILKKAGGIFSPRLSVGPGWIFNIKLKDEIEWLISIIVQPDINKENKTKLQQQNHVKYIKPPIQLHLNSDKIIADAEYDGKSFTVFKGSLASNKFYKSLKAPGVRRHNLMKWAVLHENYWQLITDVEFVSPSTAATFCLGYNANGWIEWVDYSGRCLGELLTGEKTINKD